MIEKTGETATTEKIRRTKRHDERGRGNESERGRDTQVTVKTLTSVTKQSTGAAEATTQSQSPLMMTLYSELPLASRPSSYYPPLGHPIVIPIVCPPCPLSAGELLLPV